MLKVDQEKCIGCGLCSGICPDSFVMDEDGKSQVASQDISDCTRQAQEACPVDAIEIN